MEKEYRVSWLKVFGIILGLIVIVFLIYFLYPKHKDTGSLANTTYINNINLMKEAGFEYFKGSNLPEKIGDSSKITLEEMIDSKLLLEFYDDNGKSCDVKESYVKVTKTLDNEYAMKVSLSCEGKSDYIVTSIGSNNIIVNNSDDNNNDIVNKDDKTSGSVVYNNYYYNNSSSNSNKQEGTTITKYNINYVYTCKDNCNNDCKGDCTSSVYYYVYFDSDGGSYVPREMIKAGEYAEYRVTSKSGYTFLGWYLNGVKYDFKTPVKETITLKAKWEKSVETKHEVKFLPNNGEASFSEWIEDGNRAAIPSSPTKKCYKFLGWYLNGVKYDFNKPVLGDIVLEAKWQDDGSCKKIEEYLVEYNTNGGTFVPSERVLEGNYATRPSKPTMDCKRFVAWHVGSLNGAVYNFDKPVYSNLTLVAEWEDDGSCNSQKYYTVSFNTNGGGTIKSETILEGNRATEPRDPSKSGYTFLGWFDKWGDEFDFRTRIYQDTTLYAHWEKDQVKYNTYCKINTERVYSTSYIARPENNKTSLNVNYTLELYKTRAKFRKIVSYGNLSTLAEYNSAYRYLQTKSGNTLNMVESASEGIDPKSGTNLRATSLKSYNMTPIVTTNRTTGNYWYFNVNLRISGLNNVINAQPFYPNKSSSWYIYFTPLYFDIEYTDLSDCVNDLASRSSSYRSYEITDTYYR